MREIGLMGCAPLSMVMHRLDAIQSKINEWEGADAGLYQVETLDLSGFGEIVNQ